MKITDIIRGILDQVDARVEQPTQEPEMVVAVPAEEPCAACGQCPCACNSEEPDLLAIIQQLAGVGADPEYANEPVEVVAPLQAAFPAGDDMHHSKNPSDIRTNAPSMYPGFQAEQR